MNTERPNPDGATDLDDLVRRLQALKLWAGLSYRELHRRIVDARRARRVVELPAYATVYRCLQPHRSRLDVDLLAEIAYVLTGDEDEPTRWRQAYSRAAGEVANTSVVSVMDRIPDDVADFAGRAKEYSSLIADERGSGSTVVISAIEGMAGVGKTALVIHAARELLRQGRFVDIQLWVNLRGFDAELPPADPAAVLDGFLRALGVTGRDVQRLDLDERVTRYRQEIASREALIVLDNASSEEQIRPLLPDSSKCLVLVTSRRQLRGLPHLRSLALDVLDPAESLELVREKVGADRVDAEPVAARQITEQVGHLPLALAIEAARIRSTPNWSLTDHLERLVERRRELRLETGVDVSFALSYEGLSSGDQRMLRRLSLHPGRDCDTYAAVALADCDLATARQSVDALVAANLLTEHTSGRYELHDLVRVFAAGQSHEDDPPSARRAAITRLLDYYRYAASAAMERHSPADKTHRHGVAPSEIEMPPMPDQETATAWLDTERANLLATATDDLADRWPEHVKELSFELRGYLSLAAHYLDAERLHLQASRVSRGVDKAHALNNLGVARWRLGRPSMAARCFEDSLAIAHETEELGLIGRVLSNLGNLAQERARYEDCLDYYARALDAAERANDSPGKSNALGNIGIALECLGRYADAMSHYQQAIALSRDLDDRATENRNQLNLANVYLRLGRHDDAIVAYERVRHTSRELGDRAHETRALLNLAEAFEHLGDPRASLVRCREAHTIAREIGDRLCEGMALCGIGTAQRLLHDASTAVEYCSRALDIARELGYREGEIESLSELGQALAEAGRKDDGLASCREALAAARKIADRYLQARVHVSIAHIEVDAGDLKTASDHWRMALVIFDELGSAEASHVARQLREHARADT